MRIAERCAGAPARAPSGPDREGYGALSVDRCAIVRRPAVGFITFGDRTMAAWSGLVNGDCCGIARDSVSHDVDGIEPGRANGNDRIDLPQAGSDAAAIKNLCRSVPD
jgi:hypothetical protein